MKTYNLFGCLCGSSIIAKILVVGFVCVLTGCNPKVSTNISKSYPTTAFDAEIAVIELEQTMPNGAEVLGSVKIGDTGFTTNCDYSNVLELAKLEARKVGGNAIKITEHNFPTAMGSSCHRITASILHLENVEAYLPKDEDDAVIPDVDYAILNVYRYSGAGSAVSYDLHLGDSVVCRVKNNYKTTLHIKKSGLNTLWAKTEAKSEVPITLKPGHTYYLRCGVKMGAFVGHPHLELIDNKTGKSEFESFNAKNQ